MSFSFRLPASEAGARKFIWMSRLWPYILLFCLSFICFSGLLYIKASINHRLIQFLNMADRYGMTANGLEMSFFPPRLAISQAQAPIANKKLEISSLKITPALFPLSLEFNCSILGGTLQGNAKLDLSGGFGFSRIQFNFDNISIKDIFKLADENSRLLSAERGTLKIWGTVNPAYLKGKPDLARSKGEINLELDNGEIRHKLPMLIPKHLKNITGDARLIFNGLKCEIARCVLNSLDMAADMSGGISQWPYPAKAALDINLSLRMPARMLEKDLTPPRIMARIKQDGMARAHIGRTLLRPSFRLEN